MEIKQITAIKKSLLSRPWVIFPLLIILTVSGAFVLGVLWSDRTALKRATIQILEKSGVDTGSLKEKIDKTITDYHTPEPTHDEKKSLQLDNLIDNQVITTPSVIHGSATGNWFFEGSFPVVIKDEQGKTILTTFATADGEWMTTSPVLFHVKLPRITAGKYVITFTQDDPSGGESGKPIESLSVPIVIQ